MHEILIKVGDNPQHVDPNKAGANWRDGDVIFVTTEKQSKAVWDEMLANGRKSQAEYDAARISPGVFKFPWGKLDKKDHAVFVTNDNLSEPEIRNMMAPEEEEYIDSKTEKLCIRTLKRCSHKIDVTGISLNQETIDKVKNKNISVEPDYNNPISKAKIKVKV